MPLSATESLIFNHSIISKQKIKLPVQFFSINRKVSFSFFVPANWTVGLSIFFLIVQTRINFTGLLTKPNTGVVNTDFRFYTTNLDIKNNKSLLFFFLLFRFFLKVARQFQYTTTKLNCVYSFKRFQSYNITDSCSSSIALNEVFWHSNVYFSYPNKFLFLLFLDFFKLK